jgi:hypothetical protein
LSLLAVYCFIRSIYTVAMKFHPDELFYNMRFLTLLSILTRSSTIMVVKRCSMRSI